MFSMRHLDYYSNLNVSVETIEWNLISEFKTRPIALLAKQV